MHSTSFHLSRITYVFLGIIAGVFMGTTIRFVYASWSAPTVAPPDGNVDAPLNVSDTGQTKTGGLNLGSLIVQGSAKINQRMQIGDISTNDPVVYAACDGTIQGTMRFNDANDTMEYCDGSVWKPTFGGGSGGGGNITVYSTSNHGCTAGRSESNASQRKTGVTYTNDSQSTRIVMVSIVPNVGVKDKIYINDVEVMGMTTDVKWGWVTVPATFYVPSGATYKVDAQGCWYWTETEI